MLATTLTVLVVVIAVLAGRKATEKPPAPAAPTNTQVTLVNAATLRTDSISVSANGTVESLAQADLKSQSSAPISAIDVAIGDSVSAGQTILELQNTDIRAQLAQAEASLAVAQGTYGSTRQSAIDKVRDAYLAADNAVHSEVDPIILNNLGTAPQLYSYVVDPTIPNQIRSKRIDMNTMFTTWKPVIDSLSATSTDDEIHAAIVLSQTNLTRVSALLDTVSGGINNALTAATPNNQTTLNTWQASISAARMAVNSAQTGLSGVASTLATTDGASTAAASVSVAQASVNNLQAQLDKTIIRSPIAGKISALPLRVGELATPGTLLASVVGSNTGLQVKAMVSGTDLPRIKAGQPAVIQGNIKGVVSNVSPSVDPTTRQAEVNIAVSDSAASGLIVGQNVPIVISTGVSATPGAGAPASPSANAGTYVLPIQDVKIVPGNAYVLTVDQNSKIVFNPVTIGRIQGDFVQITGGMNDSMNIVTPVYELNEGEAVNTM